MGKLSTQRLNLSLQYIVSPVVSIKLQRKQTLGMSKMLQTRDVLTSLRSLAQTPGNTADPSELTEPQAGVQGLCLPTRVQSHGICCFDLQASQEAVEQRSHLAPLIITINCSPNETGHVAKQNAWEDIFPLDMRPK